MLVGSNKFCQTLILKATCVPLQAKTDKQKYVKLNDYTKMIIEKSHDRYFHISCMDCTLNRIKPNENKIEKEIFLRSYTNFIFGQKQEAC